MIKKVAWFGLVLILVSGVLFEWARRQPQPLYRVFPNADQYRTVEPQSFSGIDFTNQKGLDKAIALIQSQPHEDMVIEQRARLVRKLDELAVSQSIDPAKANILYGPDWVYQVNKYKRLNAQLEFVTMAWIGLGLLGAACLVMTMFCLVVRTAMLGLTKASESLKGQKKEDKSDAFESTENKVSEIKAEPQVVDKTPAVTCQWPPLGTRPKQVDLCPVTDSEQEQVEISEQTCEQEPDSNGLFGFQLNPEEELEFAQCLTDRSSVKTPYMIDADALMGKRASAQTLCPTLEAKAEDVARQLTQARTLVQDPDPDTQNDFQDTLQALTDQISAIRQYASSQQDRVEKLQSGYDWNIIRTFCLRVIRSIDQLEERIERLADEPAMVEVLCEIRDELLFSLESSGVEQFDLDLHSEFRGQERLAEAVKEKEPSDVPDMRGCIAQVIKPGYQYVIDEDQVKIVRTARVKLYG